MMRPIPWWESHMVEWRRDEWAPYERIPMWRAVEKAKALDFQKCLRPGPRYITALEMFEDEEWTPGMLGILRRMGWRLCPDRDALVKP